MLSVIVPTYKRIDQTVRTVSLLLASKRLEKKDFEVIVADCTPDDSLEQAISAVFKKDVRYVRSAKRGVSTNKNTGAHAAKGEILIFCDSDIEVEPDTLHKTQSALQRHQLAAGLTGTVFWRNGLKSRQIDRPERTDRMYNYDDTSYLEVIYSRYFATYADIFHKVGSYDETVFNMRGEGADLSTRYWRKGYPLAFDSSIVVHHVHDAPDSIGIRVTHPEREIIRDWILLAAKFGNRASDHHHFAQTMQTYVNKIGSKGLSSMFDGIVDYADFIAEALPQLKKYRELAKDPYDFPFLEVFSDKKKLIQLLENSKIA